MGDDEIIDNNYYMDEAEEEYIKENNSEFNSDLKYLI